MNHLTDEEARELSIKFGRNTLPQAEKPKFYSQVMELFKEPMLILLGVTSLVYFALGELGESLAIGFSVLVVIGISLFQKVRTESALNALKQLSSPRALVTRSGVQKKIPAVELVPQDLVLVSEGDRVPADGVILDGHLKVDESLLTGEAIAVSKNKDSEIYSSTLVVGGQAYMRVVHTGTHTKVGSIGKSLARIEPNRLRLSKEIASLTKLFAYSGAVLCLLITVVFALTHQDWLNAFLMGLATALALLPEEFAVVLTVFMAIGAYRLSKLKVLVRKPEAIERLGAVTTLCVDKTGTLTENRMKVTSILAKVGVSESEILICASMATPKQIFDPTDIAFHDALKVRGITSNHQKSILLKEYPLTPKLLAMSFAWKLEGSEKVLVATKGSPEAVMNLCELNSMEKETLLHKVRDLGEKGQRVIGVASTEIPHGSLPSDQSQFKLNWMGLVGLEDPLREGVKSSVEVCRDAGIKVKMITGDYPATALSIAEKAGIENTSEVLTGKEMEGLDDETLKAKILTCNVFARMVPEQKLRIVNLLQEQNEVVGMTGDGVNDAPSLKSSNVGISMGARGTDVAREASDIVLLDDNFASIVSGVHRGRIIFGNIKKALSYIVSIHVPIAGLAILPVLAGWPLILLPVHIVLLELIIDPVSSLLFESQNTDEDVMKRPPRSMSENLFKTTDQLRSLLQGGLILIGSGFLFWYHLNLGSSGEIARSAAFSTLILSNFGLIVADISRGRPFQILKLLKSKMNVSIAIGFLILFTAIFFVPPVYEFLKLTPLSPIMLIHACGIAFLTSTLIGIWNWVRA